jgi:NADPH:quinone reductase-like Zn-dependent oxidoreductase
MDAAGVIDKLGPGSESRFAIGDRVVAFVVPTGPHGGAYAQQVVVPAASTVAAPVGKTHFQAVTLLLNAFTARLALDALALRAGQPLPSRALPERWARMPSSSRRRSASP